MQHSLLAGGLLTICALVMAGCTGTGNFDVQQTEPFRVQLEGAPQTVVVSDGDSEAKEVVIDTCSDPCADDGDDCTDPCDGGDCADPCASGGSVSVKVLVQPKTVSACLVKIVIKDKVTGEVLEEREVSAGSGSSSSGSSTGNASGNTTVTQTQTQTVTESSSGSTVVQNFFVNVKGNHNIVVLTQAIEGSANVQVSAAHATGNGEAGAGNGSGTTVTASGSASASASASSTGGP